MRDVQRNPRRRRPRYRLRRFLFAVVRDVQRNPPMRRLVALVAAFLFAVVRDVQRNGHGDLHHARGLSGFYSLSCETYSGTATRLVPASAGVSIRCRARRTAERGVNFGDAPNTGCFYSLSCETYSGTVRSNWSELRLPRFLFAVVRDVQRNWRPDRRIAGGFSSFYSLSCETYSGTRQHGVSTP